MTRAMPTTRLWITLWVVAWTRSVPLVENADVNAFGQDLARVRSAANLASTASAVGRDFSPLRIRTIPSTTSSSVPRPTIPRRGLWPTIALATWRT